MLLKMYFSIGTTKLFAGLAYALVVFSLSIAPTRIFARGTSYEAQIGGFIVASLQTFITGEFAGRRPSQADIVGLHRSVCTPPDYEHLRAVANDQTGFDALHRRCKFVEFRKDNTHVHGTAYLPTGYCETLKTAFETMLAEQIYAAPPDSYNLVIEYKGSRFESTRVRLARGARLQAACQEDGSLRVSGPRKRR